MMQHNLSMSLIWDTRRKWVKLRFHNLPTALETNSVIDFDLLLFEMDAKWL